MSDQFSRDKRMNEDLEMVTDTEELPRPKSACFR